MAKIKILVLAMAFFSFSQTSCYSQTDLRYRSMEKWLDLYLFVTPRTPAVKVIEKNAYNTLASLSFPDWILIGKGISDLESNLVKYIKANRMKDFQKLLIGKDYFLYEKAIVALGYIQAEHDYASFLIDEIQVEGRIAFEYALVQSIGAMKSKVAADHLAKIVRDTGKPLDLRQSAFNALRGKYAEGLVCVVIDQDAWKELRTLQDRAVETLKSDETLMRQLQIDSVD